MLVKKMKLLLRGRIYVIFMVVQGRFSLLYARPLLVELTGRDNSAADILVHMYML